MDAEPQNQCREHVRQQAEHRIADHGPHRVDVFGGQQVMPDVHDGLGGGHQHEQVCGPSEIGVVGHHGDRVDDRRGVEHGLKHHFPDMAYITKVHVQRTQQQGESQCDGVQLDDAERHQQHAPCVVGVGKESEDDHHHQVDGQGDHRTHGGGGYDDVVREVDLAQQVAPIHDGAHAHAGGFREEVPQTGAAQQRDRECRCAVRELEEAHEHHIHDGEQHQRFEHRPEDAQERSLVSQLEIGLH